MHEAALRGDLNRAAECFQWLGANPDFVVDGNAITTVIQAAANGGNFQGAQAWFGKLLDYGLNATIASYTAVITAAAKNGLKNEAKEWFEAMQYDQIKPDTAAFGAVMSAFANSGDLIETENYLDMMSARGLKPNRIIFGIATRCMGFLQLLGSGFVVAITPQGLLPAHLSTQVLRAASRTGNEATALKWFERMKKAGMKPGVREFTELINLAGRQGNVLAADASTLSSSNRLTFFSLLF